MKISVIMAVYNGEEKVKDAIESIINQTFKDFEFIIINDCSTDNSLKLIEEMKKKDNRIKIYSNSKKIGLTKSLNKAIKFSNGEFIARQDDDDISLPQRLEKQIFFLHNNINYAFCGCNGIIKQNGQQLIKFFDIDEIKKNLIIENCFTHSTILIRRDILQKFGSYNEKYYFGQDYELWNRLIYKYQLNAKNLRDNCIIMNIPIEHLKEKNKNKYIIQKRNEIKTKFLYLRYSRNKFKGIYTIMKNILELSYILIFNRKY